MGFLDWLWGKSEEERFAALGSIDAPPSIAPPRPPPSAPPPSYSIESAIELMRALPFDENPELVLRVLRKTLRSTGVSVEQIIASAKNKEGTLAANIAKERAAIEQLEREIATRRSGIEGIDRELHETQGVRERLEQAMEGETKVAPMPPEVMRLQAEVASRRPPPVPPSPAFPEPTPEPHPVAKPSTPPVPKSVAPPVPKKPFVPKLPTHKPLKPDAPPASAKLDLPVLHAEPLGSRDDPSASSPTLQIADPANPEELDKSHAKEAAVKH